MPPEWAPQDWLWIGFPHDAEEWPEVLERAQEQIAAFANAARQVFGPEADPADLYDFFKGIDLSLVYDQPAGRLDAEINLGRTAHPHGPEPIRGGGGKDRVRGGTWTLPPLRRSWTTATGSG